MNSARLSLLAAPLAIAAFAAGPAHADTYCVHQPGTPCAAGTVDSDSDLQVALNGTMSHPGADTVEIGPGTYVAPANGFTVSSNLLINGKPEVSVVGSGSSTIIQGTSNAAFKAQYADLSHFAVESAPTSGSFAVNAFGGTLADLTVTGTGSAPNSTGIGVGGAATLRDSTITGVNYGIAASASGGNLATIQDTTVSADTGVTVYGAASGGTLHARRLRITASSNAINDNSGDAVVEESTIALTKPSLIAVMAQCAFAPGTLTLDHVTILGSPNSYGLSPQCNQAGRTASITVSNSSLRNVAHWLSDYEANGGASAVSVDHSDVALTGAVGTKGATVTLGDGNIAAADPGFVSDTDPHLMAGSPLIDAGAPGAPLSATDLDGLARLSGSAQDIGAYEFQVPAAPGGGGGGGQGGGGGGGQGGGGGGGGTGGGDVKVDDAPKTMVEPSSDPVVVAPQAPKADPAPKAPTGPTTAELRDSLRVSIATASRTRYAYAWLTAGTVRIEWRVGSTLVARGTATRTIAGRRAVLRLATTRKGRALLRTHHRVTVRASFTPQAGASVSTSSIRKVG